MTTGLHQPTVDRGIATTTTAADPMLGRMGTLTARLVANARELDAAQALRFRIFHNEFGACNDVVSMATQRDSDRFDAVCDHLIVVDESLPPPVENRIVGTYRLLPHDRAATHGFYSADEFDISGLAKRHGSRRFLELGRSCVLPQYRSRRTIELLWQGIWAYCRRSDIDTMVGCASFPGTNPLAFAEPLSFLHHFAGANDQWDVRAVGPSAFVTDFMPAEAINARRAVTALPPLVKGYLKLGAHYAQSAVVDPLFNSIDVFVILPVEQIDRRYIKYYGENAERFAA